MPSESEINKILITPEFKERVAGLGAEPTPMSPAAFGAKAQEDTHRFA